MRDRRELLDAAIGAFNARDWDGLAAQYTEDAELTLPGRNPVQGKAAVIEAWKSQMGAFPDAKLTVIGYLDGENSMFSEVRLQATHGGPLPMPDGNSVPPTGKSVDVKSASVVDLEGDLIKKHRLYGDNVELITQLGIMPAAAQA